MSQGSRKKKRSSFIPDDAPESIFKMLQRTFETCPFHIASKREAFYEGFFFGAALYHRYTEEMQCFDEQPKQNLN